MANQIHGNTISRQNLLDMLYEYEMKNNTNITNKDKLANEKFANLLLHMKDIDELIQKNLDKWDITQLNKVNLSTLRLSIYEMVYLKTPPGIIINDALDFTDKFSDVESKKFIHKILAKVCEEIDE